MYERLLNKEQQPTLEQLADHCQNNKKNFQLFNAFLTENYQTTQELRFPYGKDYGWCVTHRKGKNLICNVFAEAGAFSVMVRLSDSQLTTANEQGGKYAREQLAEGYPCKNGSWIHYRISQTQQLADLKKVLIIKLS